MRAVYAASDEGALPAVVSRICRPLQALSRKARADSPRCDQNRGCPMSDLDALQVRLARDLNAMGLHDQVLGEVAVVLSLGLPVERAAGTPGDITRGEGEIMFTSSSVAPHRK